MTILIILLGVSLLVLSGGMVVMLFRPRNNTSELLLKQEIENVKVRLGEMTKELGDRLQENLKFVQGSVQESNRVVGQRLDKAAQVVGEVQHKLGELKQGTDRIFEVGKNIASLQEILRAPKLRGSLGELFLGDLLAQALPKDSYELQYSFKSGEKVDAIIRSAQGLISIDSKFPLENFKRVMEAKTDEEKKAVRKAFLQDVKKHIDAISKKYILPAEGTLDIGLMYIPAENVYYEIILKSEEGEPDLLSYAQEKRVFPVSPNSFYAYLQTISIGLRGMQLASGIREVRDQVDGLKKEFGKFTETFTLVGKHLSNARGSFETADKQFQRLGDRLETLGLEEGQRELRLIPGGDA